MTQARCGANQLRKEVPENLRIRWVWKRLFADRPEQIERNGMDTF